MNDRLYELCKELLNYVDKSDELIHDKRCHLYPALGCTCGLTHYINEIRIELEAKGFMKDEPDGSE